MQKILHMGHNTQEEGRAEYLIIAKKRLISVSAPYAPSPLRDFSSGAEPYLSNFKSWPMPPPELIHQGHMPLIPRYHASEQIFKKWF